MYACSFTLRPFVLCAMCCVLCVLCADVQALWRFALLMASISDCTVMDLSYKCPLQLVLSSASLPLYYISIIDLDQRVLCPAYQPIIVYRL